jgi:hypothetical protein
MLARSSASREQAPCAGHVQTHVVRHLSVFCPRNWGFRLDSLAHLIEIVTMLLDSRQTVVGQIDSSTFRTHQGQIRRRNHHALGENHTVRALELGIQCPSLRQFWNQQPQTRLRRT